MKAKAQIERLLETKDSIIVSQTGRAISKGAGRPEIQTVNSENGPAVESFIELSGGIGIDKTGKIVSRYLVENGRDDSRVANARDFSRKETYIHDPEDHPAIGEFIAKNLPAFAHRIPARQFDRPRVQIKILLGKDMSPFRSKIGG